MTDQNALTFTDASFDADVLRSDVPVLVDFWTEGCGGCLQIAPLIDSMASEYRGKAKIGKLDAVSNCSTALRYNIRGLPALLLFEGGNVVEQQFGVICKAELQKMIDRHL